MKIGMKKATAFFLSLALVIGCPGCAKKEKEPKPEPKVTAKVNEGNADASGEGDGQADVPLVISCKKFSKNFNPFTASNAADRQAVSLTQIPLVRNDRSGKLIYQGIDGEVRPYGDENYTYYSASNLSVHYDKASDSTTYHISLRDDLVFSDGEKLTSDDVIFTMYVLCDTSYKGNAPIKDMPIKGLLNYRADSTKAEKLPTKKVARFIRKKPKKLKKWIQKNIAQEDIGSKKANSLIERQARILLAKGTGKRVKKISGIKKISAYGLTVTTDGYSREMSKALQIPICALHYYGDTSKFDIQKNSFGFRRGNISSICANKTAPMGAGAYRFVKFEDGIAYFTSNDLYYLGCPKIAYLQLKDMEDTLEETRHSVKQKLQDTSQQGTEENAVEAEEAINPLAEVTVLTEKLADAIIADVKKEDMEWIGNANSNKQLSGNTIDTQMVSQGTYYYIGINSQNVSVGRKAGSKKSKCLRKALATILAEARNTLPENSPYFVSLVDYPVIAESWVSPEDGDSNYSVAYGKDLSGDIIFTENGESEDKTALAKKMALEYLTEAGYQTENGKITAAPQGASPSYTVWVADGQENLLYPVLEQAKNTLAEIGLKLDIQNLNQKNLEKKLKSHTQQLWVGTRGMEDIDIKECYGTEMPGNLSDLSDKKIDLLANRLESFLSLKKRKQLYQKCFQRIFNWAAEIPVCECQNLYLFSATRIRVKTLPKDTTPYYSWLEEIQKVEMK